MIPVQWLETMAFPLLRNRSGDTRYMFLDALAARQNCTMRCVTARAVSPSPGTVLRVVHERHLAR